MKPLTRPTTLETSAGTPLSGAYLHRAAIWVAVTTLAYFLLNGAQVFETATIVPSWTADPPESLAMFAGEHGVDFKAFWITAHSLHELTFILAIAFTWKIPALRNWLLVLLAVHIAVRIWTVTYFAPTIIDFQQLARQGAATDGADLALADRAARWQAWNYLRVAVFIAVSLGLLPVLARLSRASDAAPTLHDAGA